MVRMVRGIKLIYFSHLSTDLEKNPSSGSDVHTKLKGVENAGN